MDKNILIIGAARSGKTTLARKFNKAYGYSVISLDDIISGFEEIPQAKIQHNGNEIETAKNFGKFLTRYLDELSQGTNFYGGIKFVIEGTHIDFEEIIPFLNKNENKGKYEVIGLVYNDITEEELYQNMKKYDTEDDWTYWCSDEELKGNAKYFIQRNKYFNDKFNQYNITKYDVSKNRDEVLDKIVKEKKNI